MFKSHLILFGMFIFHLGISNFKIFHMGSLFFVVLIFSFFIEVIRWWSVEYLERYFLKLSKCSRA